MSQETCREDLIHSMWKSLLIKVSALYVVENFHREDANECNGNGKIDFIKYQWLLVG